MIQEAPTSTKQVGVVHALCNDEKILGFTIDNKVNLKDYIRGAKSAFNPADKKAVESVLTGEFTAADLYVEDWKFPCGAFHGAEGGSC